MPRPGLLSLGAALFAAGRLRLVCALAVARADELPLHERIDAMVEAAAPGSRRRLPRTPNSCAARIWI